MISQLLSANPYPAGIALEEQAFAAALRLFQHMAAAHWTGEALAGPDPGKRFEYRAFRFVKSYVPGLLPDRAYRYLQAQGYWTLANWRLLVLTGSEEHGLIARACSDWMVREQRADGAWEYPVAGWGGVANFEGTWASLALLESYRNTGCRQYLSAALRWRGFLEGGIGFGQDGDEQWVNYYAEKPGARVVNNSCFVLRFLAELASATGDAAFASRCPGLLRFIARAQKPSGEFPYSTPENGEPGTSHFQCYQYNAFQTMDLMAYYRVSRDERALVPIARAAEFLASGVAADGHAMYECDNPTREVYYHTGALAAAFRRVSQLGLPSGARDQQLADRCYAHLLRAQSPEGGFPFSRGDYGCLRDNRGYPRYLAMMLYHLL